MSVEYHINFLVRDNFGPHFTNEKKMDTERFENYSRAPSKSVVSRDSKPSVVDL